MINWNEVKTGETEIERTDGHRVVFKIVAIDGDTCWCKDEKGEYYTHKKYLFEEYWTIYDPWEEISDQVEWKQLMHCDFTWCVFYEGKVIYNRDSRFKFDGRRVWKRKEGRDE